MIGVSFTIVWPGIFWITILSKVSLIAEILGVMLPAFPIYHDL